MALDLDKSETAETFLREIRYLPTPAIANVNTARSKIDFALAQTIPWDQLDPEEVCFENLIRTSDINGKSIQLLFHDSLDRTAAFELLSILHQSNNNSRVATDAVENNVLLRETDRCSIDVVFTVADRQKVIRVLGVSHYGDSSIKDVEQHILHDFKPDTVVIEWDEERLKQFEADSKRCCSQWCSLLRVSLVDYITFGEKLAHLKAAVMNYNEIGYELFHAASLAKRRHLDLVLGDSLFWHGYARASRQDRKPSNSALDDTRSSIEKREGEKLDKFGKNTVQKDPKQRAKSSKSLQNKVGLSDGHDEETPFVVQMQTVDQVLGAIRKGEITALEAAIRIEALVFAESTVSEQDYLRARNAELAFSALFGFFNGDDDRCLIVTGWAHVMGIIEILMEAIQEKSTENEDIAEWMECHVAMRRALSNDEPKFANQALQFAKNGRRRALGETFLVRFFLTTPFLQTLIKVADRFGEEDSDIARMALDLIQFVVGKWCPGVNKLLSASSLARLKSISQQLREAHENDDQIQSVASRIIDMVNKILSSM